MSDDRLGAMLFMIYWMVPNIAAAIAAWGITEPPMSKGWEATKEFFGMAAMVILFGIPHTFFWLFACGSPFIWAFNKAEHYFNGAAAKDIT